MESHERSFDNREHENGHSNNLGATIPGRSQNGAAIFYQPLEMFKEILMSKQLLTSWSAGANDDLSHPMGAWHKKQVSPLMNADDTDRKEFGIWL